MNKNWIEPDMSKFATLVLCHERPEYNKTIPALRRCGYTGRIFVILDNLDTKIDEYMQKYGYENVFVYNKSWVALKSDAMNNFGDRRATLFVRNATFDIAKELGLDYFLVLDDDYESFCHKQVESERVSNSLDIVFYEFVKYLINTPIMCLSFSQGGDHIGGFNPLKRIYKRKSMNSYFCMTNRRFSYYGTMNDDTNMYLINGAKGLIYLTFYPFMLHQEETQKIDGGLSDIYKKYGTYVKSFYSVMCAPSCCKIQLMGDKNMRLHHNIKWDKAVPCIINPKYKKL